MIRYRRLTFAVSAALMFCSAACTQAPPAPDLKALEAKSAESAAKDVADIKALEDRFTNAVLSRDVNAIMTFYVPDASLFVFDVTAAPVRGRGSLSEGLG